MGAQQYLLVLMVTLCIAIPQRLLLWKMVSDHISTGMLRFCSSAALACDLLIALLAIIILQITKPTWDELLMLSESRLPGELSHHLLVTHVRPILWSSLL
jgi:hypothetical protein